MASHKDAQQNKEVEPLICACQGFGAFLQQCPPKICVLPGTPGGSGPGSLCTLPVSMTHLCWEASVCAAGARCHTSASCEHSQTWLYSWEALRGCWPLSYSWRVGNRGKKYRGGFALLGQEGCAGTWLSDTFPAAHQWLASAVGQALECAGSVGSLA